MFVSSIIVIAGLIPLIYVLLDWWLSSMKLHNYKHKCVLITSCDSGVGRFLALRLNRLGFHVFAGCRTVKGQRYLANNSSQGLVSFNYDPIVSKSVENAFNVVKDSGEAYAGLWALINTTDELGLAAPSEMCTPQNYLDALETNLYAPIMMSKQFLPLLRKARGRIINTHHTSAEIAYTHSPYVTSKFGLQGYSDMLRREVYRQGVKVSIVQTDCFYTEDYFTTEFYPDSTLQKFKACNSDLKDAYLDKFIQNFLIEHVFRFKGDSSSSSNELVEAFLSAVTDRFPRTRYTVGRKYARWLSKSLDYLPDWLVDHLVNP